MDLQFTLKNQVINRIDRNTVVSGSRNYLYAKFVFLSEDWHAPVTVIFDKYSMVLDGENKCLVPWEVLENPGSFTVSAFCGDLQTANTVSVYVEKTGYIQGETPEEPTPDVYAQLAGMVQDAIDRADAATEAATGAATSAGEFADNAEKSAQAAAQSELSAAEAATAAGNMAADAAASAQAAQQSAEQAAQVVVGAGQIVKDAETAALAAINKAESAAVLTVNQAGQIQTNAVNQAGTSALSSISTAKTDALNGIDSTKNDAVGAVNTAGTQAASDAQTAITAAKNQAVSGVESAGQSAVGAVEEAQTTALNAITEAQTAGIQFINDAKASALQAIDTSKTNAVQEVQSSSTTAIESVKQAGDEQVNRIESILDSDSLDGKTIVLIGDSTISGTGWPESGGFEKLIKEKYPNCQVRNLGVNGATLINNGVWNQINPYYESEQPADIIIIGAGINDLGSGAPIGTFDNTNFSPWENFDESTTCGALEMILASLLGYMYQDAKVFYFNSISSNSGQIEFWDTIKQICQKWSVPFLDFAREGCINVEGNGSIYLSSYLYLNEAGYRRLWPMLDHALQKYI